MTPLLKLAFEVAAKLSPVEQDVIGSRLLTEIAAEDSFDRAVAASAHELASMAATALAQYRAGQTEPLDVSRL